MQASSMKIGRLLATFLIALPATVTAQQRTPAEMLAAAKALGDTPAARELAQKAADQGLAEAWYWLGNVTSAKGDPIPYYAKAAELGYDKAFEYLLDDLLFRAGEKADVAQAKKFGDLVRQRSIDLGSGTAAMLDTIDRCFAAGKPAIPPSDLPAAAERQQLEGEDCAPSPSPGSGAAAHRKYAACLLSQKEPENRFLAEVYANGWGVRRNPKLAVALICHGSDVPAELIDMVRLLEDSRDAATLDPPFLFCDHVLSGMNQGLCAMRDSGPADAKRDSAWDDVTASWSAEQRAALARMRAAADAFFEAHVGEELDQRGTARIAIDLGETAALADALLASVREFEAGRLPARMALAAADADLNAAYASIMRRKTLDEGTVTKDGIRGTQRKWLAYRDAWTTFAALRYPRRTADEWKAWITTVRTAQLKTVLGG
jgi:uncharacterized protein YecT (DUF1311 family)